LGRKLFVGNLTFSVVEDSLKALFSEVGKVDSCKVITDRDTGRSKGFAFVEMSSDAEATAAISKFNGYELEGRALTVNEARPQERREGGGGGGGGGGYRGGGGGGRGGPRGGGGGGGRW
jgi:RNA recognition motif-containing protein